MWRGVLSKRLTALKALEAAIIVTCFVFVVSALIYDSHEAVKLLVLSLCALVFRFRRVFCGRCARRLYDMFVQPIVECCEARQVCLKW